MELPVQEPVAPESGHRLSHQSLHITIPEITIFTASIALFVPKKGIIGTFKDDFPKNKYSFQPISLARPHLPDPSLGFSVPCALRNQNGAHLSYLPPFLLYC